MAVTKKFKPKNIDEYIELKPGIWARKDRTKKVVVNPHKNKEVIKI